MTQQTLCLSVQSVGVVLEPAVRIVYERLVPILLGRANNLTGPLRMSEEIEYKFYVKVRNELSGLA